MSKNRGQAILGALTCLLILAALIFFTTFKASLPVSPLIFLLIPILFIITFINTDSALILLIFSMLLSPELSLGSVSQRALVIRIDDILLIVIFFSWLAKMAIGKQLGLLKHTPLNVPMVAYIVVCFISTGISVISGHVRLMTGFFYILKYLEYFMLFFMVTNNIRSRQQIKTFTIVFLITCVITCFYALSTVTGTGRATAPFEGAVGEPNTLGGYLVLLLGITTGLFLYSPSKTWQYWCVALGGLMFFTLLQTLSRGSYVAFLFMYLALIFLTRQRKVLFAGLLVCSVIIFPFAMPAKVAGRIERTFASGRTYQALGKQVTLDKAASARVESWRIIFKKWGRRPLLGYGVTGVGLVDSQYPRVLGETGIIGFWIFIWLLVRILKSSIKSFKLMQPSWERGLVLGFLAAFIGIIVHCFSANTFIIVRIMEPFWFLAAVVIMLPHVQKESQAEFAIDAGSSDSANRDSSDVGT